ncbi:MAG: class II aldolase/adducin family protein [Methylocystaceae bacterium]
MLLEKARHEVVEVARAMYHRGLVVGTWGNVSRRQDDYLAITPSGMDYEVITPEDIIVINFQGDIIEGKWRPSTEWQLHGLIYEQQASAQGIVHTHSPYAAAFAVAGVNIPPVLEETAQMLGGEVRVAAYAPAGTRELAEQALIAIQGRQACLLANHGMVAVGRDGWQALQACQVAEKSAMVTILAGQLGNVNILDQTEVDKLRAGFAHYGQTKLDQREG